MADGSDHEVGTASGSCSSVCCACCNWQVWFFSADPDQGMEQAAASYREHSLKAHARPLEQRR